MTTHQELWTFIVTNLASVYIREGNRHQEVGELLLPPALKHVQIYIYMYFNMFFLMLGTNLFFFNQQLYSLLERINPDHNFPVR